MRTEIAAAPPAPYEARPTGPSPTLPVAHAVLAVVARPGDESYYLGAVLDAFRGRGASVNVLTLTRGEDAPYNESLERLETIRPFEFEVATFVLGTDHRMVVDFPDNGLSGVPIERLAAPVVRAIREWGVDLVLTIDGRLTGRVAAHAACVAGRSTGVPVLAWTLPHPVARVVRSVSGIEVTGDPHRRIDFDLRVTRRVQECAMRAHHSQAPAERAQRSRLAVQDDHEWLRWLVPPGRGRRS